MSDSCRYSRSAFDKVIQSRGTVFRAYEHLGQDWKWTLEQISQTAQIVADSPVLTLHEIHIETPRAGLPAICPSTLHNYLKPMLITMKPVQPISNRRNATEIKQERMIYCHWFMANQRFSFINGVVQKAVRLRRNCRI
jgi:hypothetical protein